MDIDAGGRSSPEQDRAPSSLDKNKKKGKKARRDSGVYEEETQMQKRERETTQFSRRINQEKSYFKGFTNKFEGIAEAMTNDEESVAGDQQATIDQAMQESTLIKPKRVKNEGEEGSDEEGEGSDAGEGDSGAEKDSGDAGSRSGGSDKDRDSDANSRDSDEKSNKSLDDEGSEKKSDAGGDKDKDSQMSSEMKMMKDQPNENELILSQGHGDGILRDKVQRMNEDEFVPPCEAQLKSKGKMRKLDIRKLLESA